MNNLRAISLLILSMVRCSTGIITKISNCPKVISDIREIGCGCKHGQSIQMQDPNLSPVPLILRTKFVKLSASDNITGRFMFQHYNDEAYPKNSRNRLRSTDHLKPYGYVALVLGRSDLSFTWINQDLDDGNTLTLNLLSDQESRFLENLKVPVKYLGTLTDLKFEVRLGPGLKDVAIDTLAWNRLNGSTGIRELGEEVKCIGGIPWSQERTTVYFDKIRNKLYCKANSNTGTVCGKCGIPKNGHPSETLLLKKISINAGPKIYSLPPYDVLKGPVLEPISYQLRIGQNSLVNYVSKYDLSLTHYQILVRLKPCFTAKIPKVQPTHVIFVDNKPVVLAPKVPAQATRGLDYSEFTVLTFTTPMTSSSPKTPPPRIVPTSSPVVSRDTTAVLTSSERPPDSHGGSSCGVSRSSKGADDFRIIGGQRSELHEWPWQVLVMGQVHFECSGSIIGPNLVLTAAHCFMNLEKRYIREHFKIVAGTSTVKYMDAKERNKQILQIKDVISHQDFKRKGNAFANDIAIVILKKNFDINTFVSPICLPTQLPLTNFKNCVVSGFGDTRRDDTRGNLNHVYLPIINSKKCNATGIMNGSISKNMVCAGYLEGGKDACQGDSGGPLACMHFKRWHLVGIVSWGIDCAKPNLPGVYTHVIKYLPWIKKQLKQITSS